MLTPKWIDRLVDSSPGPGGPKIALEQFVRNAKVEHQALKERSANVIATQKKSELRIDKAEAELKELRANRRTCQNSIRMKVAAGLSPADYAQDQEAAKAFGTRAVAVSSELQQLKSSLLIHSRAAEEAKASVTESSKWIVRLQNGRSFLYGLMDLQRPSEDEPEFGNGFPGEESYSLTDSQARGISNLSGVGALYSGEGSTARGLLLDHLLAQSDSEAESFAAGWCSSRFTPEDFQDFGLRSHSFGIPPEFDHAAEEIGLQLEKVTRRLACQFDPGLDAVYGYSSGGGPKLSRESGQSTSRSIVLMLARNSMGLLKFVYGLAFASGLIALGRLFLDEAVLQWLEAGLLLLAFFGFTALWLASRRVRNRTDDWSGWLDKMFSGQLGVMERVRREPSWQLLANQLHNLIQETSDGMAWDERWQIEEDEMSHRLVRYYGPDKHAETRLVGLVGDVGTDDELRIQVDGALRSIGLTERPSQIWLTLDQRLPDTVVLVGAVYFGVDHPLASLEPGQVGEQASFLPIFEVADVESFAKSARSVLEDFLNCEAGDVSGDDELPILSSGEDLGPERHKWTHDVFLSFASEDIEVVGPLSQSILDAGLSCFWDRDLKGGALWRSEISSNLRQSAVVVVVWSRYSVDSTFVVEEAQHGLSQSAYIPCHFGELPNLPFGFHSVQSIFLGDGVAKDHARVDTLIDSIAQVRGRR